MHEHTARRKAGVPHVSTSDVEINYALATHREACFVSLKFHLIGELLWIQTHFWLTRPQCIRRMVPAHASSADTDDTHAHMGHSNTLPSKLLHLDKQVTRQPRTTHLQSLPRTPCWYRGQDEPGHAPPAGSHVWKTPGEQTRNNKVTVSVTETWGEGVWME